MRKTSVDNLLYAVAGFIISFAISISLIVFSMIGPQLLAKELGIPNYSWLPLALQVGRIISGLIAFGMLCYIFPILAEIVLGLVRTVLRIALWIIGFNKDQGVWKFHMVRTYFMLMFILLVTVVFISDYSLWKSTIVNTFLLILFIIGYQSVHKSALVEDQYIPKIYDQNGNEIQLKFRVEWIALPWLCFTDWVTIFAPLAFFVAFGPMLWAALTIWLWVANPHLPFSDISGHLFVTSRWWYLILLPEVLLLSHWYMARGRRYELVCHSRDKKVISSRPKPGLLGYLLGLTTPSSISPDKIAQEQNVTIEIPLPRRFPQRQWFPIKFKNTIIFWLWDPGFQFGVEKKDAFWVVGFSLEAIEACREWVASLAQK